MIFHDIIFGKGKMHIIVKAQEGSSGELPDIGEHPQVKCDGVETGVLKDDFEMGNITHKFSYSFPKEWEVKVMLLSEELLKYGKLDINAYIPDNLFMFDCQLQRDAENRLTRFFYFI